MTDQTKPAFNPEASMESAVSFADAETREILNLLGTMATGDSAAGTDAAGTDAAAGGCCGGGCCSV